MAKQRKSAGDRAARAKANVEATLDRVVELFETGDVPKAVAFATFPSANLPSAKWSLRNRVLMLLAGTTDARGFKQWQDVDRHVTKGSKAVHILGPCLVPDKSKPPGPDGRPQMRLIGFRAIPVFRVEDTSGEPVEHANPVVPSHPLMDVAEAWGVRVTGHGFGGGAYGWTDGSKVIGLCTAEEGVFFHELAHCADSRNVGKLKGGQDVAQELVAELAACTLAKLVGREVVRTERSARYLQNYAREWFPDLSEREAVRKACERILSRCCRAVETILMAAECPAESIAA